MNVLNFVRDFGFKDNESYLRYSTIRAYMDMVYSVQMPSPVELQTLRTLMDMYVQYAATKQFFCFFPTQPQQYRLPVSIFKPKPPAIPRSVDVQALFAFLQTSPEVDAASAQFEEATLELDSSSRLLPSYNALRCLNKPLLGQLAPLLLTGSLPDFSPLLIVKRIAPAVQQGSKGRSNAKAGKSNFPAPPIKSLAPLRKDRGSIMQQGVFSSFSKAFTLAGGDILSIVNTLINFLPPVLSLEKISQRSTNIEGNVPSYFAAYMVSEFKSFQSYVLGIATLLHDVRSALSHEHLLAPSMVALIKVLKSNTAPDEWKSFFFYKHQWPLNSWLEQLNSAWQEWDKLSGQNFKPCSYNLSMFSNPAGFLACLQLSYMGADRGWKDLVLQADVTSRERDILREPASDGVFVHGLCVYNASIETGELKDAKPHSKSPLPIVQFRFLPREKVAQVAEADDDDKAKQRFYMCPCFVSLGTEPLFSLKFAANDALQLQQWSLSEVCCTLF
jgi:hypothetical protein